MSINVTKTGPLKWDIQFTGWHAVAFFSVFVLAGVAIGASF